MAPPPEPVRPAPPLGLGAVGVPDDDAVDEVEDDVGVDDEDEDVDVEVGVLIDDVLVFVVLVFVVVLFVVLVVVEELVLEEVVGLLVVVTLDVVEVVKIPWQLRSASWPTVCTPACRLDTSVPLTEPSDAIERFSEAIAESTPEQSRCATAVSTWSSWLLRVLACVADSRPALLPHPTSAETATPRPPATNALFAKRIG